MRDEIIASPFTIWLAPVGTSFPDVDEVPGGSWLKLGASGTKNLRDDGVSVKHDAKYEEFIPAGATAPQKVWRTEEHLTVEFELVDLSAAQYAKVLNDATVQVTAAAPGVPGTKKFALLQGLDVALFALLARGLSTEDNDLVAQYQVPIVYQSEAPSPSHKKDEPAGLACIFSAIEDDSLGFGDLVIQTAVAL